MLGHVSEMVRYKETADNSYYLVNEANLVHSFSQYVHFYSLHVSGDCVPIIRNKTTVFM